MKKAWQKTRVDRMLVDHILRAGHYSAAMSLAESSGIEVRRVEGERVRDLFLMHYYHRNLLMWTSLLCVRE